MRYVDDLVLRDRDTTGNGTLDERLYSLQDALFNVVALTDDTGAVKERFAYQPYGESETLTPAFATRSATLYNWETRFTGRELDLDTGLQINRNRYYHNQLGRWLTRDPIGYADGLNLYEYSHSNAINLLDPNGKNPIVVGGGVVIAGGIMLTAAEGVAISFGLSLAACIAHPLCNKALADALKEAAQEMGDVALEILKLYCKATWKEYKLLEKFCSRCNSKRHQSFWGRCKRCAHATPNAGCWTAVAARRAQYLFSGCDFVLEKNNWENHAGELMSKLRAAKNCAEAVAKNCVV